ncbi:MAG TPA: transcription termination factor Rho [Actinomycetota bacterium]|nr:transcription termination factor Rho [Actinomycetota bacterium]
MDSRTLERSDLEGKVLAELQQIAQAVGVENHRMKKSDLIDAILAKASENGQDAAAVTSAGTTSVGRSEASGNGPAAAATGGGDAGTATADAASPATDATAGGEGSVTTEAEAPQGAAGRQDGGGAATGEAPARQEGHGRAGVMERPRRPSREERRRQRELRREREREEREQELAEAPTRTGILDILPEGYGFLRTTGYLPGPEDVYVSLSQIRRFGLRRGDVIAGQVRSPRDNEKYPALLRIETVAEVDPDTAQRRPNFDKLTPLFPDERYRLEHDPKQITERIIDLVAPVGKGQRGMVVSPPKAGKTTVLKQIAGGIIADDPNTHVMILLVDERPEEVTDWQRTVEAAEVVYSTFDKPADQHTQVTELVLERAKRLVEQGRDVAILLDSITRLARAYNLAAPASGRILSGGVDSTALYPPKRFFGAARNLEEGGSLTIIASALVETGSRMDEVIFEEFKGTGNWEIRLDRQLSEKRIFPALNIEASGTRKEERLLSNEELALVWRLRRVLHALEPAASLELLIDKIRATKSNDQFLKEISKAPVGE